MKNDATKRQLTSFVTVEANANVKPARLALIFGFMSATTPVTPTITLLSRLNRVDTQRFTFKRDVSAL